MVPDRRSTMLADRLFTEQQYEDRLAAARTAMAGRELDICLLSTPENIYYLTGLDHWGYFAPHMLILPQDGEMVLIARAMEQLTVANQVRNARFEGHEDNTTAADVTVRWLRERAPRRPRIGIEKWSSGLPCGLAEKVFASLPEAIWLDVSGVVDQLRAVKSPAEQRCMRAAAGVSDAAMRAAIDAIRPGATERHVAAERQRAMIEAGSTLPGFGPFIRPGSRLGEEHTSWGYRRHHCGYLVGIGFPPSWTGGNRVSGLRQDSDLVIREGMAFHIISWLMGTGRGDHFVSDAVLLGADGPEVLTRAPRGMLVQ